MFLKIKELARQNAAKNCLTFKNLYKIALIKEISVIHTTNKILICNLNS